MVLGVLGEAPTLDPYAPAASDLTYHLARPAYRSLARIDPDGVVHPDLVNVGDASSMQPSKDGVVVTIEEAQWSDGSSITAADVVRSAQRATPPSGFVGLEARAVGPRRIRFSGDNFGDWARRLAVGTYVVPDGKPLRTGSGPFVMDRYVPGLEVSYRANPEWPEDPPASDRITVRFVASVNIMLELLERGRLDVAAVPSTVNIDQRVTSLGFEHASTNGWESIVLDLDGIADVGQRTAVVTAIDRVHIQEGLIRDAGRVARTRDPQGPGSPVAGEILLGTANGDELLQLMQRVMQRHLAGASIDAELVTIDPATLYGEWESEGPLDVALRREIVPGFGRAKVPDDLSWLPLFEVDTFLVWNRGVDGPAPNGTLDGPLWNAEEWSTD